MDKRYPSLSFKNRIKKIKKEAEEIGQMTMGVHRKTIDLIENYDKDVANEVIAKTTEIDLAVFNIERRCLRFIVVEQPVAGDLMFIESTIRITSHIKRIAYLSSNITESLEKIKEVNIPPRLMEDLKYMADYVQLMLSKSIYCFLNQDISMARELNEDDNKVDDLFDSILHQSTDLLAKNNEDSLEIVHIIFAARFFERIADRCVNIGARTIFMMTLKRPDNQPQPLED